MNTAENKPIGAWKSIPVTQGDKVKAKVFSHYVANTNNNNASSLFLALGNNALAYGTQTLPTGETKLPPSPFTNLTAGLQTLLMPTNPNSSTQLPKAYLAIIQYNENNQIVGQAQISYVTTASLSGWIEHNAEFTATTNGRIEVFVANESNTNVWFDDLEVSHTGTMIVQETHYDPWGMELVGIGKKGDNRFKFMGKETESNFDLNWIETDWRGYDAQLGRFHQIDKMADKFSSINPYQYSFNNPIMLNDPSGLEPANEDKAPDSITNSWLEEFKYAWKNFIKGESGPGPKPKHEVRGVVATKLTGKTHLMIIVQDKNMSQTFSKEDMEKANPDWDYIILRDLRYLDDVLHNDDGEYGESIPYLEQILIGTHGSKDGIATGLGGYITDDVLEAFIQGKNNSRALSGLKALGAYCTDNTQIVAQICELGLNKRFCAGLYDVINQGETQMKMYFTGDLCTYVRRVDDKANTWHVGKRTGGIIARDDLEHGWTMYQDNGIETISKKVGQIYLMSTGFGVPRDK